MTKVSSTGECGPNSRPNNYAMGFSDHERERLMRQGAVFRESTAAVFRSAGIGPGMHVLDLGSGAGDVAMLAADMVGPTGSVLGLDHDADSVAWARNRSEDARYTNVQFQTCDFEEFANATQFDAMVGRFILMYLPDPVKTLLKLSRQLRSGGIAVFFEPDYSVRTVTFPDVPLIRSCEEWFVEALRASGACVDMGMRLHETYRSAGFRKAGSMVSHLSGCGFPPGLAGLYSETIRSVLPTIVKHDIASSNEIEIDTLAERLEAAVRIAEPQWVGIRYIGAWAIKP